MIPVLFSLKPRFAELIFTGEKTVELRRRIAPTMKGREAFIYVSSPVCMIRGGFRVSKVWTGDPESVWDKVSCRTGVAKAEYDAYYEGSGVAHALALSDVWARDDPPEIEGVREALPGFRPPQSWRYAREQELEWLRWLKLSATAPVRVSYCLASPNTVPAGNKGAFDALLRQAVPDDGNRP